MKENPSSIESVITFSIEDELFALPSSLVKRIIQAVFITPIPNAPEEIMGMINIEGNVISVINIKKLLGFKTVRTNLHLNNAFIIVQACDHEFAFVAEDVTFMEYPKEDLTNALLSKNTYSIIDKVIKTPNGFIQIINPERVVIQHPSLFNLNLQKVEKQNE